MSLYLRRDFRAALLVWGEETGSMARDTRIGVAHRNKGSVLWLESAEAVLRPGAVTSIAGRVTKTLPSTMAAPHELRAYKRIGEGFDVDVGFEVKSQNDHEISFVLHISVGNLAEGGGFPSRGGDQKLTVAAVNANDGGSSSFHDVFIAIKWAGVAYLFWLAWKMWFARTETACEELPQASSSWKMFLTGISITIGNPKIMMFYVALLPTILDLASVTLVGWLELTVTLLLVLAIVDLAWVFLAARARRLLKSPRAMKIANRLSAGMIGGAAVAIATR